MILRKLNQCELIGISIGNLEPDSAEVVVEVDDSKEADVADVDTDDDDSDEAQSDLNTDDDSKEGIKLCKLKSKVRSSCTANLYNKFQSIFRCLRGTSTIDWTHTHGEKTRHKFMSDLIIFEANLFL